jgi:hypothetical protein
MSTMTRTLTCQLDECRRKGLTVDEDFERGIGRLRRGGPTAAIAFATLVAGLLLAGIMSPRLASIGTRAITAPSSRRTPSMRPRPPLHRTIVFERSPQALA